MSETAKSVTSRREFLKHTGRVAAASALVGTAIPYVHAAEDNTIQVALVGCGGRGTGAAKDALSVKQGPVKLVAMADVFEDRLKSSYANLKDLGDKVDVPEDRKFVGFDAYRKAMDCLKPGDIAIFATPLAFRGVNCAYAVERGLNVFMEKPLTADGVTSRRLLDLSKKADAKNLKVGVGLMSRHARQLQEVQKRIQDGEIGDIVLMRGYRMHGPAGFFSSEKWPGPPESPSELLWQIRRFHSFLWASGGAFNDFYIHIVDHCCWMKNAWPVKAQALGGRHYRVTEDGKPSVDQNFDVYSVEYIFDDGARFIMDGRTINGCQQIYNSAAHGTKGMAILSDHGDCGEPARTYKGQKPDAANLIWRSKDRSNPYQNEWDDLVEAIRGDKPYNELERGVLASAVSSLGRKAAHTGVEITLEEFLNCPEEYAPGVESFTMDSPAPVKHKEDGTYPVPMPGIVTDREY